MNGPHSEKKVLSRPSGARLLGTGESCRLPVGFLLFEQRVQSESYLPAHSFNTFICRLGPFLHGGTSPQMRSCGSVCCPPSSASNTRHGAVKARGGKREKFSGFLRLLSGLVSPHEKRHTSSLFSPVSAEQPSLSYYMYLCFFFS